MGSVSLFRHIRKADLLLAAVFLLIALLAALWTSLSWGRQPGAVVDIYGSGELIGSYALTEERCLEFDSNGYHNTVMIAGGQVWMAEASCPDQYCVLHEAVHQSGETIICLPARLVLSVRGAEGEEETLDAIAH